MKAQKIKNLLIDKGYYSDDHAISIRCITDIVNAHIKIEKEETKKMKKKP